MATAQQSTRFPYSLSIFFPAYNDAESLPRLLDDLFETAETHLTDFEVVVVDDGSQDATATVLAGLCMRFHPRLRVITHAKNQGYGAALRSGIAEAANDYVFYTDGDGQYDVRELPLLLAAAHDGAPWVNGFKKRRSDPWRRIFIGAAYREFVRLFFAIRLRDVDCDFRLIRRDVLQSLRLSSSGGTICVEMVWGLERLGRRAVEIGVTHRPRLYGKSQFFRLAPLWKTFRELIGLVRLRLGGAPLPPTEPPCVSRTGR